MIRYKLLLLSTTVKTQEPRNNLGMETALSSVFIRVRGEKKKDSLEKQMMCLEKHRCGRIEGRLQQMALKQQQGSAQLRHSQCPFPVAFCTPSKGNHNPNST